ncbi:DUF1120 domain-containing protein [Pseudomonas marginalis]|uniref:Protein GltF n=2 Tax=Pseudomonas marginalis TaxID=298 RepID=A0A3M4AZV4_PSEMA|nr:DUF1120 domain-containing protein [Pseudomonas marginalis]OAJ46769.1 hypothetical protein AO064_20765 [Pseudomonas marginalis]RMO58244.1 hypothetical protein ALQ38_01889 [Pseudomonas marginalis pv. marginalis]RMP11845.1 hypothetical protein ALQ29_04341 [Pseudomonas marginalis pv. marginalis]
MNLSPRVLATVLLAIASPWAAAASTVDLTVKGLIVPSACTPTLSNAGTIDHGKISFKDLNPTTPTNLKAQTIDLAVACDAQTLMALQTTDNRADSGIHGGYGIGLVNGNQKLGYFNLTIAKAVADTVAADFVYSLDGDRWFWQDINDAWIANYMIAPSLTTFAAPIPVQNLSAMLTVYTIINRSDALPGGTEIPIDGSATLTVRYL